MLPISWLKRDIIRDTYNVRPRRMRASQSITFHCTRKTHGVHYDRRGIFNLYLPICIDILMILTLNFNGKQYMRRRMMRSVRPGRTPPHITDPIGTG